MMVREGSWEWSGPEVCLTVERLDVTEGEAVSPRR